MKLLSQIKKMVLKGLNRMEKIFRDDNGNELVAHNEAQAAAYENQGFKAVKNSKAKMNAEFGSDLTAGTADAAAAQSNTQDSSSAMAAAAQKAAQANAANTANAQMMEFAADTDVNQAAAKAAAKNRVNKQDK